MDFKDIKKVIRFIKGLTNYGFLDLSFARNTIKKENLPTLLQESYDAIALLGFLYKEDYITYDEVEQKFKLDVYKLSAVILEGATGSFTGEVTATSGYIGTASSGWVINETDIYNGSVYLSTDLFDTGAVGLSLEGNSSSNNYFMRTSSGNVIFELGNGSDKIFKYDQSTGDITFKGGILDGDITCNGTITGGTIQTATSGQRVVMDGTNNRISFYNSTNPNNNVYFQGAYDSGTDGLGDGIKCNASVYADNFSNTTIGDTIFQLSSTYKVWDSVGNSIEVKMSGVDWTRNDGGGNSADFNLAFNETDIDKSILFLTINGSDFVDNSRNINVNKLDISGTTIIDSSGNIITPSWLKFDYDSGGDYTIHPLSNGVLRYQDYGHYYTVNEIRSAGDVTADDMEATLTLQRNNDAGTNAEFLDLFNNGYQGISMEMGIKIQKRGTGSYRDFVIQYGDGTTTFDVLRIDADDSFKFKVDKQIVANGFDNTSKEFKNTNTTSSTTYSIGSDDTTVFVTTASDPVTVTLPSPTDGRHLIIKDNSGAANTNNITIDQNASETIDGNSSYTINTDYGGVVLEANSAGNWRIIGEF